MIQLNRYSVSLYILKRHGYILMACMSTTLLITSITS